MAKRQTDDPEPEPLPADRDRDRDRDDPHPEHPIAGRDRDRHDPHPEHPIAGRPPVAQPKKDDPATNTAPTPRDVETTRVLLTGDNRTVLTEAYVPTAPDMFRIYVEGVGHFEHVGDGEGGVWIYAPTR